MRVLLVLIFFMSLKNALATNLSAEQIDILIKETQALREEVSQLKKQLHSHTVAHHNRTKNTSLPLKKSISAAQKSKSNKPASPTKTAKAAPAKVDNTKTDNAKSNKGKNTLMLGGFPVIINPYLGKAPSYDGSDLVTNLSSPGTDLLALQYRQELNNTYAKGSTNPADTFLVLSGSMGAQVFAAKPYLGPHISDIDLTFANISALAGIGKWVTGFFSLDYDSAAPNELTPPQIGARQSNSRVYVSQSFMTLGNLNEKDWYMSVGQMTLPFGQYNGYMVNSPLTSSLFSITERPLLLGYSHSTDTSELDFSTYIYKGETITTPNASAINEWGLNLDYLVTQDKWNGDLGVGYISNIADSEGFQSNGQDSSLCSLFGGYAFSCNGGGILAHRVPGFDIHSSLTIGSYNLVAEYITATKSFSPLNMTFNEHGAKPQAFDIEGAYTFKVFNKPSNIAFGYSFTKEALALMLPAQEYSFVFTTSMWRQTTESLGFQHDINYGKLDRATGQRLALFLPTSRVNLGKTSDTIILAINASF